MGEGQECILEEIKRTRKYQILIETIYNFTPIDKTRETIKNDFLL